MANFVEINNVEITYQAEEGQVCAIKQMDFAAQDGEFITIVGPSGCGKTTILKAIAGLLMPTRGSIKINGTEIKGTNPNIGIVFQNPVLMAWRNILQNIMIQAEVRHLDMNTYRPRAQELIRLTGLSGFENKWPHQLSGGMQQRAALCRALLHDPSLLLMDEPFGALDAFTREIMNIELQRIWLERKKTVLFITHSIQEAVFLADKVVVLSPRPGIIQDVVSPRFSRPRDMSTFADPEFAKMVGHIRGLLSAEALTE